MRKSLIIVLICLSVLGTPLAATPTEGAQPFPYSDILLRPVPNLHCNPKRPEYRQQWEHPVEQKKVKSQAAGLCSRR